MICIMSLSSNFTYKTDSVSVNTKTVFVGLKITIYSVYNVFWAGKFVCNLQSILYDYLDLRFHKLWLSVLEKQLNGQRQQPGWIQFRHEKSRIERWRENLYKDNNNVAR